jgi:hypothetical protein
MAIIRIMAQRFSYTTRDGKVEEYVTYCIADPVALREFNDKVKNEVGPALRNFDTENPPIAPILNKSIWLQRGGAPVEVEYDPVLDKKWLDGIKFDKQLTVFEPGEVVKVPMFEPGKIYTAEEIENARKILTQAFEQSTQAVKVADPEFFSRKHEVEQKPSTPEAPTT